MTRRPFVSLWLLVATVAADASAAEERPAIFKETTATTSPIEVERAATPAAEPAKVAAPPRPRPISPALAAQLSAMAPKVEAPPSRARTEPAAAESETRDPAEADKPRNRIIRLPSYLVQEDRVPVLKEREILTPKARLEKAFNRHPGLRLGSFWIFRNDGIALAMLEEEERLERKKEMQDLVSLLSITEQKQVKPIVEQAFIRQPDLR